MSTFIVGALQQLTSPLLIVVCFYFTLTYFHHLKIGDDRGIKNTKWAAVLCLALALILPFIYNFLIFMMRG